MSGNPIVDWDGEWVGDRPAGWSRRVLIPEHSAPSAMTWEGRFPSVPGSWEGRFPKPRPKVSTPVPPRRLRRGRPAKGPVTTYVIGIEGSPLVKIGYTSVAPHERRSALQTGLPFELTLLWSTPGDFETQLHDMYEEYRVRGEWFDLTSLGDPVQVVRAAVQKIRVHQANQ